MKSMEPDCGAVGMEQCPSGCNTCLTTFWHVARKLLYTSESAIVGQGLFADVAIAKDTMILKFVGKKIKPTSDTNSDGYVLQIDSQTWIYPTGIHWYVNHSCNPNAEFRKWTNRSHKTMVSIVALKDIARGEEIRAHYGAHHDLSTRRTTCRCNAENCVAKRQATFCGESSHRHMRNRMSLDKT